MTKEECEKLIKNKLDEIFDIAKQYNENTEYLSMSIVIDKEDSKKLVSINNSYWDKDKDFPIHTTFLE